MGTWSISPTGKTATINSSTGVVTFETNTGSSIIYTITYTDGDNCGSATITQPGGCSDSCKGITLTVTPSENVAQTGGTIVITHNSVGPGPGDCEGITLTVTPSENVEQGGGTIVITHSGASPEPGDCEGITLTVTPSENVEQGGGTINITHD